MADVGKKTDKQTQTGRDVYETPEGKMVSEKSTTFEYKGKWINIPTIHNGKQYSDAELIEMLEEGLIKPTSIHNKLEEAIQAAQSRSDSLEFNKGGIPMLEKQMELFNEGGLKDEGGEVDPVSGNDVPIGSTKEEVRDDIPAMVSEGEFVFPADVVRYIGLNTLMNMRQEAKMGLKKMEAMGQMGNSEEATLPDDMPFGMADIVIVEGSDEPKEMAQGGVIQAQTGTFVTPMFNPSNQDVREYKNAEGQSLFIPFLNGQPVYPIPEGYFPVGQVPTETEAETSTPADDDDDGGINRPPVNAFTEAGSWTGSPLDMYIKEADKVTTFGNLATGVGTIFNPFMGGFMAMAIKGEKRKILDTIDSRIKEAKTQEDKDKLEDIKKRLTDPERKNILEKAVGSVFDGIKGIFGFNEKEEEAVKEITQKTININTNESNDATQKDIEEITKVFVTPEEQTIISGMDSVPSAGEKIDPVDAEIASIGRPRDEFGQIVLSDLEKEITPVRDITPPVKVQPVRDITPPVKVQPVRDITPPERDIAPKADEQGDALSDLRASIAEIRDPQTALDQITNVTNFIQTTAQGNNNSLLSTNEQTEKLLLDDVGDFERTSNVLIAGEVADKPDPAAAQATKDKKAAKKRRAKHKAAIDRLRNNRTTADERREIVSEATGVDISGQQETAGLDVGSGAGGSDYVGPMRKGGLASRKK